MKRFLIVTILIWLQCAVSFAAQVDEELSDDEKAQQGIKIVSERLQKDFPFSVEARIFFPNMDAHIKSHEIKIDDDALSLKSFGMDSNVAPEYILRYKNFSVDYIRLKGDGGNSVDDLTFGGQTYNGVVNSESDLHYIKLNVDREIISLMGTKAAWNYGITGVKWRGSFEDGTENYFFPIPTIGIALEMKIQPKVKVYTNISGVVMGGHGHLCDFEGGFAYIADENFLWKVGYRHIDAKVNWRSVHGDFKLNGFYTGLRADF
ncbi:MAG: hypothetical protein IKZ58_00940 [Selenomonadaceae bacterium]|nr:hypothetical protein [Selenomonadaceae bacterium]